MSTAPGRIMRQPSVKALRRRFSGKVADNSEVKQHTTEALTNGFCYQGCAVRYGPNDCGLCAAPYAAEAAANPAKTKTCALLDDHATVAALDAPHPIQQEHQKAPQRYELEALRGKVIIARWRLVAPRTDFRRPTRGRTSTSMLCWSAAKRACW